MGLAILNVYSHSHDIHSWLPIFVLFVIPPLLKLIWWLEGYHENH